MRWRKAHQNKRRAILRAAKAKTAKRRLFSTTGWRDWLKQLGPEWWEEQLRQSQSPFIDWFWNRARNMNRPYPFRRRRIQLPLLPGHARRVMEGETVSANGTGMVTFRHEFVFIDDIIDDIDL